MHHQRHRRRACRQRLAGRNRDDRPHPQRHLSLHHPHQHQEQLVPTSRLVSSLTGLHVQRNKAIVGENAFAHESGIHQDGMLKHKSTYEIMTPSDVGLGPRAAMWLGKHSGRHAYKTRLEELGYRLTEEELNTSFDKFKALCDKKKDIYDEDLEAIVEDQIGKHGAVVPHQEHSGGGRRHAGRADGDGHADDRFFRPGNHGCRDRRWAD